MNERAPPHLQRISDLFAHEYLPRIYQTAQRIFSHLTPDLKEDAVQEVLCMAYQLFIMARRRHKRATAQSLLHFALQLYRGGRRFCGRSGRDALGPEARCKGRSKCLRLHSAHQADTTDPAEAVRIRLDYSELLKAVGPETRAIAAIIMAHPHSGDNKRPGYPTAIYEETGIRWQRLPEHLAELRAVLEAYVAG